MIGASRAYEANVQAINVTRTMGIVRWRSGGSHV